MTAYEAILNRHSVRAYTDQKIEKEIIEELYKEIDDCNLESGLSIQLITDAEGVFNGLMPYYGGFRNVKNYIALVGSQDLKEKAGYYGERLVIKAQMLGLNTCWTAVTFKKKKCSAVIKENQELICVIAIGYGKSQGNVHKSKPMDSLCTYTGEKPGNLEDIMEIIMQAPTAMNKQNFMVVFGKDDIKIKVNEDNYSDLNLGILKYHLDEAVKLTETK